MPIPLMIPPQEESVRPKASLRLVPLTEWKAAALAPRAVAHLLDLLVVNGCSLYSSKLTALLLVSIHHPDIQESGKMAGRLYQDTFAYGQSQIFLASLLLLSVVYFIGLPLLMEGRTLGLGLMGFRIREESGANPGWKALWLRFFGCLLIYATGGMLALLPSLKGKSRPLIHDRVSRTAVVSDCAQAELKPVAR